MAKVFVSHASVDSSLAAEVHTWLIEAGHDAFLDSDGAHGITSATSGNSVCTGSSGPPMPWSAS